MSFKDFLKITKGKIILVIILCFLAIYVGVHVIRLEVEADRGVEVSKLKVKALESMGIILIGPVYSIAKYEIGLIFFSKDIVHYMTYITLGDIFLIVIISVLSLFYWYFLSCIIVFVYERLKIKLSQVSRKSRDPYDY